MLALSWLILAKFGTFFDSCLRVYFLFEQKKLALAEGTYVGR